MPAYTGYKPEVNPQISQEFQTAAMRFGHTLVVPGMFRRDKQCNFLPVTTKTAAGIEGTPQTNDDAASAPLGLGVRTCSKWRFACVVWSRGSRS